MTDGDTFKVLREGRKVTVRVIGIDTPETRDPRKPVQCFGREASARAKQLLTGSRVWLEADPSQDSVDRYGRDLAFVWLEDGRLFELVMLEEGLAHEYTYDLPYRYQREFRVAQAKAREQERGFWSSTTGGGDTTKAATSA